MLWSLVKVLVFVVLAAAVAFAGVLLLDNAGVIRIAFGGQEFSLGPLQAVIAVVVAVIALWLVILVVGLVVACIRFLGGDETALSRYFTRDRQKRGHRALSDAMVALASGEARLAIVKAERANRYLDQPQLTNLLIAQAAETVGDSRRASDAYRALLDDERTRFVAVRGLMLQKLAEGDQETALKLAQKAFALRPKHAETQDILLKLQAGQADWSGARATLAAKQRTGGLPRDLFRRRDAVLALQEAKVIFDETASIEAREAAIVANKKSPDLIPAAAMAARAYIAQGNAKLATRVLKKAWETQPHPDLAAAFAEIAPEETPAERVKRFRTLTTIHPEHPETRMLAAELLIAAEDFPAARRALADLPVNHPTKRALAIMAAVERGEGGDEAAVRGWLARALSAPRGPQWCCDKCHAIHAHWQPVCDNCAGFDTLSWHEPVEAEAASPTGSELLPLIVNPPVPPAAAFAKDAVDQAAADRDAAKIAERAKAEDRPVAPKPAAEKPAAGRVSQPATDLAEEDPIDIVAVVRNSL